MSELMNLYAAIAVSKQLLDKEAETYKLGSCYQNAIRTLITVGEALYCANKIEVVTEKKQKIQEVDDCPETSKSLKYPYSLYFAIFGVQMYSKIAEHSGLEWVLDNTLTEQEKNVLLMRYKDGLTLADCAEKFKVTRERIRQIEVKALRKMRHPSRADIIKNGKEFSNTLKQLQVEKHNVLVELRQEISDAKLQCQKIKNAIESGDYRGAMELIGIMPKTPIDCYIIDLGLSRRSYNVLRRHNIERLSDFQGITISELKRMRNMGKKSVDEILDVLKEHGVRLAPESEVEE